MSRQSAVPRHDRCPEAAPSRGEGPFAVLLGGASVLIGLVAWLAWPTAANAAAGTPCAIRWGLRSMGLRLLACGVRRLRRRRGQELRLPGERDRAAAAVLRLHLGEARDGLQAR